MFWPFHLLDAGTPWFSSPSAANLFSLLSAIGTVGAFFFLIVQERRTRIETKKNRDKINDLAEITRRLAEQNQIVLVQNGLMREQNEMQKAAMKHKVKADLKVHVSTSGTEKMSIAIDNVGVPIDVDNIEYTSSELGLNPGIASYPYRLDGTHRITIEGRPRVDKHVQECSWSFAMYYHDSYGFKYKFSVVSNDTPYPTTNTSEIE